MTTPDEDDSAWHEDRAWRDWSRVEACVEFGVRKWVFTILALWLAYHWLDPLAHWLFLVALSVIWWAHHTLVARADAARIQAMIDRAGGIPPPKDTTKPVLPLRERRAALIGAAILTGWIVAWWNGWLIK